jgi:hypothetical protein
MKQRNQTPDVYTYNILLWGLSIHPDAAWALGHATTLYQKMAAAGSKTPPNHVNTQILLQLCGRARNLDRLWDVVGAIPDTGPGAATEKTYAVILTALRAIADDPTSAPADAEAVTDVDGDGIEELYPRSPAEARQAARNAAVDSGRRVWAALLGGWRAGNIRMDAVLVFAMGRLLALGDRARDRADLFRLVAQAVGVPTSPSLTARLGDGDARSVEETTTTAAADKAHFDPAQLFSPSPADKPRLARPSCHILQLVLDASAALPDAHARRPAAEHYWTTLTGPSFKLTPDAVVLKAYLHILSRDASGATGGASPSARVASTLRELDPRVRPDQGSFRAALATCLRNARGGGGGATGLRDALTVYAVKRARLPRQDPVALDMLLRTVEGGMPRAPAEAGEALALLAKDVAAAVRAGQLSSSSAAAAKADEVEDLVVEARGRGARVVAATEKDWPELVATLARLMDAAEVADVLPAGGWKDDKAVLAGYLGGRHEDWFVQTQL